MENAGMLGAMFQGMNANNSSEEGIMQEIAGAFDSPSNFLSLIIDHAKFTGQEASVIGELELMCIRRLSLPHNKDQVDAIQAALKSRDYETVVRLMPYPGQIIMTRAAVRRSHWRADYIGGTFTKQFKDIFDRPQYQSSFSRQLRRFQIGKSKEENLERTHAG